MSIEALSGARTLLYKEVLRFWKVGFQTVAAPVLTAMLYLVILWVGLGVVRDCRGTFGRLVALWTGVKARE